MATRHPEEIKEKARQLLEDEGATLTEVARVLGVTASVVQGWAKSKGWRMPEVIRQVRIQEQKLVVDPALDMLIKRMEGLTKAEREQDYHESMHRLACSVPLILKQLPAHELVTKADKVAKLVEMSRNVLGVNEQRKAAPMLSLGVLMSNQLPTRQPDIAQLVDAQVIEQ
jgi:predicted transcriptional regulator